MAGKLTQLMKSFEELQAQRERDSELIRELKGKIETKDEKETQREALDREMHDLAEREVEIQEELEKIKLRKRQVSKDLEAVQTGAHSTFNVRAPEEKITMTFGGEQNCSASHLRQFIEHYKLVRMVNMRNLLIL